MSERTCSVDGCTRAHRARGFCSTCYNQRFQPNRYVTAEVPCSICGKPTTKRPDSRRRAVCSYECRWFYQNPVLSCPIPIKHPAHPDYVAPVTQVPRTRWVAGSCQRCGDPFVSRLQNDAGLYCSDACKHRASNARRRARTRGAVHVSYSRVQIFERDRWRCHICRKLTLRTQVVPHPRAPTIDHLIPLIEGGADVASNIATAHFLCNSTKGERGGNEQLALL